MWNWVGSEYPLQSMKISDCRQHDFFEDVVFGRERPCTYLTQSWSLLIDSDFVATQAQCDRCRKSSHSCADDC